MQNFLFRTSDRAKDKRMQTIEDRTTTMKMRLLLLCILSVIVSCEGERDQYSLDSVKPEPEERIMEGAGGFIRVSDNNRYFQHSDGTQFIPIGHNGNYERKIYADKGMLNRYFSHMKEHGENVYRFLLDVFPLPSIEVESTVGEFNPEVVKAVDNVIEAAEKHGIYLIIAFWPGLYEYPIIGNWQRHSYNRNHDPQNGVVDHPWEILTNEAAIAAAKERIRFFVERWGSSPNIFSWELWNELNAVGSVDEQNMWIEEMGSFLKKLELELYGAYHLRTASTNNAGWGSNESGIYSSPELDFTSYHTYDAHVKVGINPYEGLNGVSRIAPIEYFLFIQKSAELAREKSDFRPILGTEDVGIVTDTSSVPWPLNLPFENLTPEQRDDFFIGSAWASIMGGGSGPNLRWPCNPMYDEDAPQGYFDLSSGMFTAQKAMRKVLSTIDWTQVSPVSAEDVVDITDREDIIPMALTGENEMVVWLLHDDPEFSGSEVRPSVMFRNLQRVSYRIKWYDLRTGNVLQEDQKIGPELTVLAPNFRTFTSAVVTVH